MTLNLACIIEGHGESEALPIVLRRMGHAIAAQEPIRIVHKVRIPRGSLLKTGELERAVDLVGRRLGGDGVLLILLDSDDDPPCLLGPNLCSRARRARPDLQIEVILARREFEAWFLAAADSLGFVSPDREVEEIRGAKEELAERMGGKYSPSIDQAALAARFDLQAARRARSFDRFYRKVEALLAGSGP
jgi:hypothetical protein